MADQEYLTVSRLSIPEITRIFSKITVSPTGCWLWTANRTRQGYGKIHFRRRHDTIHRVMWAWLVGPLPRGKGPNIPDLDHIVCDTTSCCFPGHLKLGPPRDNILRSNNAAANNARKTHCKLGHELPKTAPTKEGRVCAQCRKDWHTSERYKTWNAEFGRNYHTARRYGPDREALLKHWRDYMRDYNKRKKIAGGH